MARSPRTTTRTYVEIFESKVDLIFASDNARALVATLAAEAADHARDLAPVNTGAYRDSIVASGSTLSLVTGLPESTFGSEDASWHLVEFGSAFNPAYRPLTQAAERAGLEFRPA